MSEWRAAYDSLNDAEIAHGAAVALNIAEAQVHATLAVAEALTELTDAIKTFPVPEA